MNKKKINAATTMRTLKNRKILICIISRALYTTLKNINISTWEKWRETFYVSYTRKKLRFVWVLNVWPISNWFKLLNGSNSTDIRRKEQTFRYLFVHALATFQDASVKKFEYIQLRIILMLKVSSAYAQIIPRVHNEIFCLKIRINI